MQKVSHKAELMWESDFVRLKLLHFIACGSNRFKVHDSMHLIYFILATVTAGNKQTACVSKWVVNNNYIDIFHL